MPLDKIKIKIMKDLHINRRRTISVYTTQMTRFFLKNKDKRYKKRYLRYIKALRSNAAVILTEGITWPIV